MITYKTGNLLAAQVEALVNTVNTVGVMGKGIALQFREQFPENYKQYRAAVKNGELHTGKMFVTEMQRMDQLRYIINFPTKQHWKAPSQMAYIREGLHDLRRVLIEKNIRSVAIPPLGCGNGGLDWQEVRPLIEAAIGDLNIDIVIYEPSAEVALRLEKETKPRQAGLTPPRAMLLYLLYQYRRLGEYASEFAAEKLMYFLQRLGEPQLKLNFQKHHYGPYSGKVRHVLYQLNGEYLTGMAQKNNRPFDILTLLPERKPEVERYLTSAIGQEERKRLEAIADLIEGFQSPAGLELLASLDFLIRENNTVDKAELHAALHTWSPRKKRLFTDYQIGVALQRLMQYKAVLYPEQIDMAPPG
ncbi:MAG: macro domain-containing protein [Saprospiraceae bacterium]|nr:macro domain-containing protein [Saprospiraceae bacterium]